MDSNFFACKNGMTARALHLAVTAMTASTADGCQAGTDRRRRVIGVDIGGGETGKKGGVVTYRLASYAWKTFLLST